MDKDIQYKYMPLPGDTQQAPKYKMYCANIQEMYLA